LALAKAVQLSAEARSSVRGLVKAWQRDATHRGRAPVRERRL